MCAYARKYVCMYVHMYVYKCASNKEQKCVEQQIILIHPGKLCECVDCCCKKAKHLYMLLTFSIRKQTRKGEKRKTEKD